MSIHLVESASTKWMLMVQAQTSGISVKATVESVRRAGAIGR